MLITAKNLDSKSLALGYFYNVMEVIVRDRVVVS